MEKPDKPVIVFAGGGTAGHINPLLSTISALEQAGLDFDCFVLGTAAGLESTLVPQAGRELLTIPRLPLPRRPSWDLLRLPARMYSTVSELCQCFKSRQVAAVVGFGGYVSTPAYLAARRLKLPVVIHEQNARPGWANRLGARWAQAVALTFSDTPLRARHGKTQVTGLPLRPSILDLAARLQDPHSRRLAREQAAEFFHLSPDVPTVLVSGGSLGALRLNQVLPIALHQIPQVQVVHLCGQGKEQPVEEYVARHQLQSRYRVLDYLTQMNHALALADVMVCRAGAATVAENTALGIPTLYVPLPVGNGEQALNALSVVEAQGAYLLSQRQLTAQTARGLITDMLDSQRNAQMRAQALSVGTCLGGQNLSKLILEAL